MSLKRLKKNSIKFDRVFFKSNYFNVLKDNLGKELLKETIRIKQVRDIFGIRAVDEVRNELNIS